MPDEVEFQFNIDGDADVGFVLDISTLFTVPEQAETTDAAGPAPVDTGPVPTPPDGGVSHGPAPVDAGPVPTPTDASPDSAIAVTADNLEFTLDVQMPSFGVEWAVG